MNIAYRGGGSYGTFCGLQLDSGFTYTFEMVQTNVSGGNNITFGIGTRDACWTGSTWTHKETQCTWSSGGAYYELGNTHGESLGTVANGGKIVLTVSLLPNSKSVRWSSNDKSFSRPIDSSLTSKPLYVFITMLNQDQVSLTLV